MERSILNQKQLEEKEKKKKLAFVYIVNARWGYKFDTRCER